MFLSYVKAFPLSGMVAGGQCHVPSFTLQPQGLHQGWVTGKTHSHGCVLTKFKLTLGRGNAPFIGTSNKCLARKPAFASVLGGRVGM